MRSLATPVRRAAAVWPLLFGVALLSCTPQPNGTSTDPASARSRSESAPGAPAPGGSNGGGSAVPNSTTPAPGNGGSTTPPGGVAPPDGNGPGDQPVAPGNPPGSGAQPGSGGNPPGAADGNAPGTAGGQPGAAGGPATGAAGYPAPNASRFAVAATTAAASNVSAVPKVVEAMLEPTKGNKVRGHVTFTARDSVLVIDATVTGLTPGKHGIHVHETGDCSAPDASSAGGHFNPDGHMHGGPASAIHHAGDLGNLDAMSDGTAKKEVITSDLSLSGRYGVIGRAVVVHADADDYHTNPAGNSGARVACGVIREMTEPQAQQAAKQEAHRNG